MKKFTTATTDIKKRRILRVVPVLAAAGILSVVPVSYTHLTLPTTRI